MGGKLLTPKQLVESLRCSGERETHPDASPLICRLRDSCLYYKAPQVEGQTWLHPAFDDKYCENYTEEG